MHKKRELDGKIWSKGASGASVEPGNKENDRKLLNRLAPIVSWNSSDFREVREPTIASSSSGSWDLPLRRDSLTGPGLALEVLQLLLAGNSLD